MPRGYLTARGDYLRDRAAKLNHGCTGQTLPIVARPTLD